MVPFWIGFIVGMFFGCCLCIICMAVGDDDSTSRRM